MRVLLISGFHFFKMLFFLELRAHRFHRCAGTAFSIFEALITLRSLNNFDFRQLLQTLDGNIEEVFFKFFSEL